MKLKTSYKKPGYMPYLFSILPTPFLSENADQSTILDSDTVFTE